MGDVRPLTEADIPALAPIHVAAFGEQGVSRDLIERGYGIKLRELVLDGPYVDKASPSLVYEHDGRINGFVVVTCRPVLFREARVWMATTTHLAVDPEARSTLAAVHLLRAVTEGPQDLTYVDMSNAAGRQALRAAGFEQMPAYSLAWDKTLRPAASLAGRLGARLPSRAGFLVNASERVAPRLPGPIGRRANVELPPKSNALSGRPLTVDDVVECGPQLMARYDLHPDFADRSVVEASWKSTEQACPTSTIVRVALTTRRGDVVGWYIAEIGRAGDRDADVLQFVVDPRHQLMAMTHMFHDLFDRDIIQAHGELPMGLLYDAETLGCRPRSVNATTSVHSTNDELVDAFRRNAAWFSGLDGELLDLLAAAAT